MLENCGRVNGFFDKQGSETSQKKNSFGNVMSVSTLIMKQKMMMKNYIYIFYRSQKTFLVRACFNIKHVTVKNNLQKGATSPIKQSLSKKISLNQ